MNPFDPRSAPSHEDEVRRLEAVRRYDILDTPPDGAFDRITALAAKLFSVPIAIISLVDHDRIWFKSHHGLGVEQIDRDPGLCASAVLQDGPWILADASCDVRALTNPLVAGEFGLRFYAGVPLRTSDGYNLGTLCVIDREPREVTDAEVAQLSDLAAMVMDQMELRRAARQTVAEMSSLLAQRDEQASRLHRTERRLNAVLGNASVAVFLMDDRQHCSYMNAAAERMTGYKFAETLGRPLHDVIHHTRPDGSHFPLCECAIDRAFPEKKNTRGEEVFIHKNGHFYPVAFNASPVQDETSKTVGTIIEVRDISAEKAAEDALRSSLDRLASETHTLEVLNRTGAQVAAELDLGKLVQLVVDAGVELTGAQFGAFFYNVEREDGERLMLYTLSGANISDFAGFGMPRPTAVFAPTFRAKGVLRSDDITRDARYGRNHPHSGMPEGHLPVRSYLAVPVTSRSGEAIGGLFFGHPDPGVFNERSENVMVGLAAQAAVAMDNARLFQAAQRVNDNLELRVQQRTAELEQAHEALRQAQKMEAIGQLTGGIAHDFNNLLTGITGSLELMQRRLQQGRVLEADRFAAAAMASANRAGSLTHRLLAFARRQPLDPKPVNANRLVASVEDLLRRTIGESVEMEMVTAGGLWMTLCDPHQLESAVLNLVINARDAMPTGGRLTIETCNAHLDNAYAAKQRDITPGQYVCICVTDTGVGMSAEVLEKAFEPFFTTKPLGQGTGLGLSMIYGFARQSDGHARIYSEIGKGTTVKIYLPRYYGDALASEDTADGFSVEHRAEHGETVLVIEDEAAVRHLVVEVLHDLGYRTLEAIDGPSGLKILQSTKPIDLLITDIGLPGLNGRQVADAARLVRPGLKILFMTGYAENATIANGVLEPGMQMITKPFAVDALATRARDMIEGK
jgi:PAS domain S-box-containing protein